MAKPKTKWWERPASDFVTPELVVQSRAFWAFWNSYPEERGLVHMNNNNSYNSEEGAKNKSLGVVRGVADLEYMKNGVVHFIELKVEGGAQTPDQIKFQNLCIKNAVPYWLVVGYDELMALLNDIRLGYK